MDRARITHWLRHKAPALALDIGVNFIAPILIYDRLQARYGEVPALLASSLPPLVWSIGGFIRNRRIDALSVLAMAGITLSLLAFIGGGSARVLQVREHAVTLLIGLAFLGSAAIGRPLIGPLARATEARRSAEALANFEAHQGNAGVRRLVMVMTLVWGFGLVADFAASLVLIFTLSVKQNLIVGPILAYGAFGGLTLWTVLYRRWYIRRARAAAAGN